VLCSIIRQLNPWSILNWLDNYPVDIWYNVRYIGENTKTIARENARDGLSGNQTAFVWTKQETQLSYEIENRIIAGYFTLVSTSILNWLDNIQSVYGIILSGSVVLTFLRLWFQVSG
jgi:hypothetical protein